MSSLDEYEHEFPVGSTKSVRHMGLTIRELSQLLIPAQPGSLWAQSCLLLGIDIGNDLGVIVPDTQYDRVRDLVFRCYRIGETAVLADRPLPVAVWTREFDAMSQRAGTVPVDSSVVTIPKVFARPEIPVGSLNELRKQGRNAIPGKLKECYLGTITSVDETGGTFDAELLTPDDSEAGFAVMRTSKVPVDQQRFVRSGARFRWSVYKRKRDHKQISRLSLIPSPVLDTNRMTEYATEYKRSLSGHDGDS